MFNVRLAGGHLYGKQLFTWLSLVVSFMASFVLSFFPLDVLDGIWDLIDSFSEGFLTYSYVFFLKGKIMLCWLDQQYVSLLLQTNHFVRVKCPDIYVLVRFRFPYYLYFIYAHLAR